MAVTRHTSGWPIIPGDATHFLGSAWNRSRIQIKDEHNQNIGSRLFLEIRELRRLRSWVPVLVALAVALLVACGGEVKSTGVATTVASTQFPPGEATSIPEATQAVPATTEPALPPSETTAPSTPAATEQVQPIETATPTFAKPATTEAELPSSAVTATSTPTATGQTEASREGNEISMGGSALGGNAETILIAQQTITDLPSGDMVWVAHKANIVSGAEVAHSHEFAFVYAESGTHLLVGSSEARPLLPGEGARIDGGLNHLHGSVEEDSTFWEVRLAAPGGTTPAMPPVSRRIFESEPLQGVPADPLAVFVLVRLPQGGQTSVHTHPGPELIYHLTGQINYENAIIGVKQLGPGDLEGIPPETPVQKRNPFDEVAEFLSWFLVDATQPFASEARFMPPSIEGENLALTANGTRVVEVSSNFGGGGMNSAYGAIKALDGDPSTEWSSNGDGDDAWIEIELPSRTNITSIGIWTRTMGTSAEISSFRVVDELGGIVGPFTLEHATGIHHFDTDFEARRLRFEVIDSSGGNTGLVEMQIFGEPLP